MLEIKDVLITQGIQAQLNTLVRIILYCNLFLILHQGSEHDTGNERKPVTSFAFSLRAASFSFCPFSSSVKGKQLLVIISPEEYIQGMKRVK